ncbi:RdgB/HAM1 family non-canonical purine NTP pyrophosphatase [Chloroflexota bacterium]
MKPKLLLATRNRAKVREYRLLLQDAPLELTDLAREGIGGEVSETGLTLEENARLKAVGYAVGNGFLVLADDSGIEVDALGGGPGPLSARYAGEGASDTGRIDFLLSRLERIPWEKRSARFRAMIAIAHRSKIVGMCEGVCEGIITFEPKGDQGFGYDPVFYLPELGRTMAELSMEEKNRVSHRGKAARRAVEFLKEYVIED